MYIIGDNQEEIKKLSNSSVHLTITSPPYKDSDNFQGLDLPRLFTELYRVHVDDSLFFLNFGHLAEDKSRPFRVMLMALDAGWQLNDTITWIKPQYSPLQGNKRLNNLTEFIFLLYKGAMPGLDRLAIGIPYQDKGNIGRYSDKDLKCRGNAWTIKYKTITKSAQKLHKDEFPLDLPKLCIKLSNLKQYNNPIVLDPFCGSGTTLIAAKELGYDCIGFEKDLKYKTIFEQR